MGRRRRGLMSEQFKYELAKDLGFYDTVMSKGWEGIRTKDAGNLVKRAIQIAEEKLARDNTQQQQPLRQQAYQSVGQPQQQAPYGGNNMGSTNSGAAYGSAYGAGGAQQRQPQNAQPQPAYAYSRQSGVVPYNPAAYPGFMAQPPAETGAGAP